MSVPRALTGFDYRQGRTTLFPLSIRRKPQTGQSRAAYSFFAATIYTCSPLFATVNYIETWAENNTEFTHLRVDLESHQESR